MNTLQRINRLARKEYNDMSVEVFYDYHIAYNPKRKVYYAKFFGENEVVFLGESLKEVKEFFDDLWIDAKEFFDTDEDEGENENDSNN